MLKETWPNPNPEILFLDGLLNTWAVDIARGYYRRFSKHSSERRRKACSIFLTFWRNSTFVMKRCQQKFPTSISPFHSLCPSFFVHSFNLIFWSFHFFLFIWPLYVEKSWFDSNSHFYLVVFSSCWSLMFSVCEHFLASDCEGHYSISCMQYM